MSDRRANLAVQPVRVEAPHVGVRRYLDDGLGERRQRAGGRVEVEGDAGASRQHPRSSLLHRPRSGLRRRVRQVRGPAQQSGGSVPAACVFFFRRPVNYNTHTHTHTHTQPFNGLWSRTTRYQKKHSPTHTHPDHRTSIINFLHLLRSIASSLFSLHARLSSLTTSLQVLFGLPLGLGSSTSYSMHFFTQSSSSFH